MKGLTILLASLGLCIQHANAAVARDLIHTTSIGATANPIPIEKIETHILDNNERIENEILLNADLAPRDKSLVSSESEISAFAKLVKCMHSLIPRWSWVSEREARVNAMFRNCINKAKYVFPNMFNILKNKYIETFTTTGWPATESVNGGTVYPGDPPLNWEQVPPGTQAREGTPA
ncbi:hypothetical protein V496_09205 [Pseudogymnoascus sp. VKM F-4515 (FW-2607)]|nr:hypothetical protein V496_09205 [Pseudogymnoascus sp. VKM F-4515 (FW-2607)]KFY68188.1 hypothetical protein V498_10723 [Pseudogymnoascus sp. VKM F-4517 (FW-2822)]